MALRVSLSQSRSVPFWARVRCFPQPHRYRLGRDTAAGRIGTQSPLRAWRGIALPGYSDFRGTYERFECSDVRTRPGSLDRSFSWLCSAPDVPISGSIGAADLTAQLRAVAGDRWWELPQALLVFISSPALQAKVPSATGCWLNFGDELEPVGDDGDTLLRVLSDQQDCLHWFVRLSGTRGCDVVVPPFSYCEDRSDWTDEERGLYEPVIDVCADSFEDPACGIVST